MQLPERLQHARNFNVAVREAGGKVVFLHRLEPGGTDRSYGIHVAQLAGLPREVVTRANAVLKTLGRDGVAALVAGNCERARQMAELLRPQPGITILNEVVLNQVLVRVQSRSGENVTPAVMTGVQQAGVCWVGGTTWEKEPAMRISLSNWSTTAEDIQRSAASIGDATRAVR